MHMGESQYNDQIIKCGSKSDQIEHFFGFFRTNIFVINRQSKES